MPDNGALELLRRIGKELDLHRKLRVYRNGLVLPSADRPEAYQLGEELCDAARAERTGAERSEAGQGQGTAAASTPGAWSGYAATSILGERGVDQVTITDIKQAMNAQDGYPSLRVRAVSQRCILLDCCIAPLPGFERSAMVGIRYPLTDVEPTRAWAWWNGDIWVGPRHTNFGDGSICAFEVPDGTWNRKQGLIYFLDLVAGWLIRHLYLEFFGRWPGRQVLHTAHERLTEHQEGEICGACNSGRQYAACHKRADLRVTEAQRTAEYRAWSKGMIQLPRGGWRDFTRWAV